MKYLACTMTALGLVLGGCSGGGEGETANNTAAEAAAALQPGEYELVAKVDDLRSTDNSTPATKLKVGGDPVTSKSCIGADNAIPPEAFAEAGESCTASETYIRNGRLNLQLRCTRPGKGDVTHAVDGQFKADTFEATVTSGSSFSGTGDYAMTRSVSGRRTGDCTATTG